MPGESARYELNKMNAVSYKHSLGDNIPFAKGLFTTAGGDVNESISVPGLEVGDIVLVTMNTEGAVPVTILSAIAAADAINVEMSADPSTDHVLNYLAFKA